MSEKTEREAFKAELTWRADPIHWDTWQKACAWQRTALTSGSDALGDPVEYATPEDRMKAMGRAAPAPVAAPASDVAAEAKADQMADRQYRAAFIAGWNAGVMGDEATLKCVQERVGQLPDYIASAPDSMAGARPVTPLTCPKCNALWLFWPKEQSGFATDSLNLRSQKSCDFCEPASADKLQSLNRIQPAAPIADQEQARGMVGQDDTAERIMELVRDYCRADRRDLKAIAADIRALIAATPAATGADDARDAARWRAHFELMRPETTEHGLREYLEAVDAKVAALRAQEGESNG